MQKIFIFFIKILEKITGKRIVTFPSQESFFGRSAVKSSLGFWYVGDVSDTHDLAFGILRNGVIEPEETALVQKAIFLMLKEKSNLVFYDIGANTGYYGILAAFLGKGKIRTFSFEPMREYYQAILDSIKLNGLESSLRAFNFALGEKAEQLTMYLGGSGSSLHKNFLGDQNAPTKQIYVAKLDEVIAEKTLIPPDFIKIDVEGHELAVINGAEQTLREHQPVLFMEMAKTLRNIGRDFVNENYETTFSKLQSLNYSFYTLQEKKMLLVHKDFQPDGVQMFLCLPKSKLNLVEHLVE